VFLSVGDPLVCWQGARCDIKELALLRSLILWSLKKQNSETARP